MVDITEVVGKCLHHRPRAGLIGLEMEMEFENPGRAYDKGAPSDKWGIVEDGSLRGGLEFKFVNPLNLKEALSQLNIYSDWLKSVGTTPVPSPRTSTHVHVNVSKLTIRELFNAIYGAWAVEYGLMLTQNPTRHNNIYCLPVARVPSLPDYIGERIEHGVAVPINLVPEGQRYAATNLNAVGKFGSMEFRMFEGTTDVKKAQQWVVSVAQLVENASKIPIKDQETMIEQDPQKYVRTLLGDGFDDWWRACRGDPYYLLDLTGYARDSLHRSVSCLEKATTKATRIPLVFDGDDRVRPVEVQEVMLMGDT